jgi:glycosyltransferase involved in cell wall biosynthesis
MNPLVSSIVTFHNQERFVVPTLDSVLAQTYPRMETIVVDDGSTDDTRARCARYGDRIQLIRRPCGGPSAARNSGLAVARGTYVAHMDGDDIWRPDKIAAQVDAARRFPGGGMIVADGHIFHDDGGPDVLGLMTGRVARALEESDRDAVSIDCYDDLLRAHCIRSTSQLMIPSAVYGAVGQWDLRLKLVADAELALRVASRYPFVFVRGDHVGYRYLVSSISGPRARRMFTWGLEFFTMLRLHRRVAPSSRRAIRERMREDTRRLARDAYHHGWLGHRRWAVNYLLRLIVASRRPHLIAPYLAGLLLPASLTVAIGRASRRVTPSRRDAGRESRHQ